MESVADWTVQAKARLIPSVRAVREAQFGRQGTNPGSLLSSYREPRKYRLDAGPKRVVAQFELSDVVPKGFLPQHVKIFAHELGLDENTKKSVLGATAYRLWFSPKT